MKHKLVQSSASQATTTRAARLAATAVARLVRMERESATGSGFQPVYTTLDDPDEEESPLSTAMRAKPEAHIHVHRVAASSTMVVPAALNGALTPPGAAPTSPGPCCAASCVQSAAECAGPPRWPTGLMSSARVTAAC